LNGGGGVDGGGIDGGAGETVGKAGLDTEGVNSDRRTVVERKLANGDTAKVGRSGDAGATAGLNAANVKRKYVA
jgi:hypothetical protein